MSDEWKAFVAVGQNFAAHETVQHAREMRRTRIGGIAIKSAVAAFG